MSATVSTLPEQTARHRNVNGNADGSSTPDVRRVAPFDEQQETNEKNLSKEASNGSGNDDEEGKFAAFVKFENDRFKEFRQRIRGKHLEHVPGVVESIMATVRCSWLNLALIFVVMSWVSHFAHWDGRITFIMSFLGLIPLEKLLQFASHQSMLYLGGTLGDLVNITVLNSIEAILGILLLRRPCELKLLQGTIIGVILLQLLLVPGMLFLAGGSRQVHQELHQTQNQLNQSMMTVGVMCLVLPAVFFVGINHVEWTTPEQLVSNEARDTILKLSRGMAIVMLLIYIGSRIYHINPPGDETTLDLAEAGGHEAFVHHEKKLKTEQPKVAPWYCALLLVVLIAIVAFTAEWLVHSIEKSREKTQIQEEWFGLVLLPLITFSGDGIVTFSYVFKKTFFHNGEPPDALADAKPIDLSIQFILFWTPLLVLIGWWIDKPLPLLFDIFEVVILVAACFIVNYILADAKTNWAEGWTMVCFYTLIALVAWFYPGQQFFEFFFQCVGHAVSEGLTSEESHASPSASASAVAESGEHLRFRF